MAAVDPQYQGFQGLVQSTKDVAPATIATVLLMGGLAKPGHMAYSALQDRAETNRRGEQADEILANTQPFRAALDRADAADLSQVLSAFNQIREAGKIPKSAMERLDSAQSAVEAELTRKQAIESQVAADTGQQGAPVPSDFLGPVNADPLADQIAAEDRRAQQSADFNANPRSIGSLLNDWNQREHAGWRCAGWNRRRPRALVRNCATAGRTATTGNSSGSNPSDSTERGGSTGQNSTWRLRRARPR